MKQLKATAGGCTSDVTDTTVALIEFEGWRSKDGETDSLAVAGAFVDYFLAHGMERCNAKLSS